jgi:hypothetical protein
MAGLIALGLVLTQVLGRGGTRIKSERAVAIARPHVKGFRPTGHTVRFVRQGIPPRGYWIVSFWTRKPSGGYDHITLVQVDASTGRITTIRSNA